MVSSEIRETVMISIAAILLASLLGFVSFLLMLRGEIAQVKNSEVYTTDAMYNFREFNRYTNLNLYGEDVTAAIRDYYDSDIRIRVVGYNSVKESTDKQDVEASSIYTVTKYSARDNTVPVDVPKLKEFFPTTFEYTAVIVSGQVDLTTVTKDQKFSSSDTNVTGIVFFFEDYRPAEPTP